MKKISIILIIAAALTAVLIVTCPKSEDHKSALTQTIVSAVNKANNSRTDQTKSVFGEIILGLFGEKFIGSYVDNMVKIDNYFVASVGRVEIDGNQKIVSFGILGHVFTPSEDDFINNMKRNQQSDNDIE